MKKLLTVFIVMTLSIIPVTMAMAQNYNELWKQVETARSKDLPQTEMKALDRVVVLAQRKGDYGQLLKAQLRRLSVQAEVAPDSLLPAVERLQSAEQEVRESQPVLSAVYCCVLGRIYRDNPSLAENHAERTRQYFERSLNNPALLAAQQSKGYEPLVVQGIDSNIFGHDLLHVIGFEAAAFETLYTYYQGVGNQEAAITCRVEDPKHYSRFQQKPAGERLALIDSLLQRWPTLKSLNRLRNERENIIAPMFSAHATNNLLLPGMPVTVEVSERRNLQRLSITVRKVDIAGNDRYELSDEKQLARLQQRVVKDFAPLKAEHRYTGEQPWEVLRDTFQLGGLPLGAYLVEMKGDAPGMKPQYALLYVSNLYVLNETLPNNQLRLVVVDAKSGQPVPGATIKLSAGGYFGKPANVTQLTTNAEGEVLYTYGNPRPNRVYVATATDRTFPERYLNVSYGYYHNESTRRMCSLYTDRAIYRPGQTVNVSLVAWQVEHKTQHSVIANETITLSLRDVNGKEVAQKQVTTNPLGVASAQFVLPDHLLTGRFTVESSLAGSVRFSVEEYKRPTFQVEFDEVTTAYHVGDTVEVKGTARSFAGVPVGGAEVKYSVVRRPSFWWWHHNDMSAEELVADTATTDADGCFTIRVPMVVPNREKEQARESFFYNFRITANVTDGAGETRHGETSLPLSNRATAFSLTMPNQVEADSVATLTFNYLNNAGKPIEGVVNYTIDGEKRQRTAAANKPVQLQASRLASGRHTVVATCGTDTLTHEFVVFSMRDKRPAVETHDWFYASASEFPLDGKPIYIQMGATDSVQHIVYTLVAGDQLIESGTIDQSNAILTRTFIYKEEYGDGALFTCAWVHDGVLYRHQAELKKPLPDKRLLVEWTTFRDRLTPGQQEEWTLRVTHPDGTPAQASLMATLFDQSLDEILKHQWTFTPLMWRNIPYTGWYGSEAARLHFFDQHFGHADENFQLSRFDESVFPHWLYVMRIRGIRLMSKQAARNDVAVMEAAPMMASAKMQLADTEESADELAEVVTVGYGKQESKGQTGAVDDMPAGTPEPQLRENLNETAFFYPALLADSTGHIALRFRLPESVTTWRFMGLAHDAQLNYGLLEASAVAKKQVMVQPNMPRFLRQGDVASIAARLVNTTNQSINGTARLQLIDPATDQVVFATEQPFQVEGEKTGSVNFHVGALDSFHLSLYVCRITAEGQGFSDGEQHYLPILPNREQVITTYPFTLHRPGTKTIETPMPKGEAGEGITVEYTDNPAWLMIQTLPTVADVNEKNAVSLAAALYANTVAAQLLQQDPLVKRTIELWQREEGQETSLMSSLEKNQQLKSLVLNETPWVAEAESETEQKKLLARYFDENALNAQHSTLNTQLSTLQNADGSFSWWPGMPGNHFITLQVAHMLVRLNTLVGRQADTEQMVARAMRFLAERTHEEVTELKRMEKKKQQNLRPSELAVDYLYLQALDTTRLSVMQRDDVMFLTRLLSKQTHALSIYGKAHAAIVLAKNNYPKRAAEYLQSIREYTVYTDEMGRYFDTPKAQYSWRDYKIPTEVAAIEALRLLQPDDVVTVEEMQRWLLQSKRTQCWDTPVNTVDAVHAFLAPQGTAQLHREGETADTPHVTIKLNGETLQLPQATAGLGYIKAHPDAHPQPLPGEGSDLLEQPAHPQPLPGEGSDLRDTISVEKLNGGTSWGAVYVKQMLPLEEIQSASAGLKVEREIRSTLNAPLSLRVGDRIRVRLTIQAERDFDFVQVIDKRAACMEPVGQLSGYHWGYYCTPRDNATHYYFDRLPKGKHIIETEYYIDRAGSYQTGTCTVQCAYAPEYSARAAINTITVKE